MGDSRDDLKVPNRFQATRSGAGTRRARQAELYRRAAWNATRALQFNPHVKIHRFQAIPGTGDPSAGVADDQSVVPGLEQVPVVVGKVKTREESVGGEKRRVSEREFVFYDLPQTTTTDGTKTVSVFHTDVVEYAGDLYDVSAIDYRPETGRSAVTARLRPTQDVDRMV